VGVGFGGGCRREKDALEDPGRGRGEI